MKYISASKGKEIGLNRFPKCHISCSIRSLRRDKWGESALIVKSGNYYYNVSSEPEIIKNV